jgi:hypothetical protein
MVQYTTFDFVIQTEHFDVYYYDWERRGAGRGPNRGAVVRPPLEGANHEFRAQADHPSASHSDFLQTNATEVSGEGTGGDRLVRNRAVMPFTGAYSDSEHVLTHEMAHQFQYDIWSRGHAGAGLNNS